MDQDLPDLNKFVVELNTVSPQDAESIAELVKSVLGLKDDIDQLHETVGALSAIFKTSQWTEAHLSNAHRSAINALLRLKQLSTTYPKLIPRTYSTSIKHRVKDRPLITTWTVTSTPYSPEQLQIARFLQAAVFIWCTNKFERIPNAILEVCAGIRRLLKGSYDCDWKFTTAPSEQLAILIEDAADPQHPLNHCIKGLKLLHGSFAGFTAFEPILQNAPIQRSDLPHKGTARSRLNIQNPITRAVYLPPKDLDIDEPRIELIVEEPEEAPSELGTFGQYARLREARYRTARENNYLPWAWESLNQYDLNCIIQGLKTEILPEHRTGALLALITLSCSVDLNELLKTRFVMEWDHLPGLQINLRDGHWGRGFPDFPGRFTPTSVQKAEFELQHDWLILPVPTLMYSMLLEITDLDTKSLAETLHLNSPNEAEAAMSLWLKSLRETSPALRATYARLRRILFDAEVREHGDELLASLVVNTVQFAPTVGYYYYSIPSNELVARYSAQLLKLGLEIIPICTRPDRFGSRLFLSPSKHTQVLSEQLIRMRAIDELPLPCDYSELVLAHAHMACYTAWMLQCATGHRAADQFSFTLSTLDDSGWSIIRDKVIDEGHQARLVRLSPIVQKQMQLYSQHLRGLAQRLAYIDESLAGEIGRMDSLPLLSGKVNYFFLLPMQLGRDLKKLGTAEVIGWLGKTGLWPSNLPRHWFISALRDKGLPGEWVSGAAGHIQAGQQPWSSSMSCPPNNIIEQWDVAVDAWLTELGFYPHPGIRVINKKKIPAAYSRAELRSGPIPRIISPEATLTLNQVKPLINSVLRERPWKELLENKSLQQEVQNAILTHPDTSTQSKIQTLNVLKRYLRIKSAGKYHSGFVLDGLSSEPSSVAYDHLIWVQRAEWLRAEFTRNFPAEPSLMRLPELSAWAILALSIETGITNKNHLFAALEAVTQHGLTHFRQHCWLEWQDKQKRQFRWWPGMLSILLLTEIYGRKTEIPPIREIHTSLSDILREQFDLVTQWPDQKRTQYLTAIETAMRAWQRHNLPGVLASYACDEIKTWAIPKNNLIRILSDQRSEQLKDLEDDAPRAFPAQHKLNTDFKIQKKALSDLQKIVRAFVGVDTSQHLHAGSQGTVNRTNTAKAIDQLIEAWSELGICSVLHLLAHYAKSVLKKKSHGHYFAASTVYDYVFTVGNPLLELAWNDDFADLESEDFADTYLQALNYSKNTEGRGRLGTRIRYFHDYLITHFDAAIVDFEKLDPAFAGSPSLVHAQIITVQEYQNAKSLLRTDVHAEIEEAELQTLALILIFRFGLRIGECFRLTLRDLVFIDQLPTVYVRQNKWGRPKSSSGFRQLPCWTMTEDELEILKLRLTTLNARFHGHKDVPIFCKSDNHEERISRFRLSQRLLQALKIATGNPACRIHHARHTFASAAIYVSTTHHLENHNQLSAWFPGQAGALERQWLGPTYSSRRLLHAISTHLGHAHLDTTFGAYTHSLDLAFSLHSQKCALTCPSDRQLAQWTGLTVGAIKMRRGRTKDQPHLFTSELIQSALKRQGVAKQDLVLHNHALPTLPPRQHPGIFSLKLLQLAIEGMIKGISIEEISIHFGLPNRQASQLQLAYNKLVADTGYLRFGTAQTHGYLDNNFYNALCDQINAYFAREPDSAKTILQIWRDNYRPRNTGLHLSKPEDCRLWEVFLHAIGAHKTVWTIKTQYHKRSATTESSEATSFTNYRRAYKLRDKLHKKNGLGQFHTTTQQKVTSRQLSQTEMHHILALWALKVELKID